MKILIADDEEQIRSGIKNYIQKLGLFFEDISSAQNGEEALDLFIEHQPDILVTDVVMPGMDGIQLAKKCRELKENVRIIMISGYEEVDYLKSAFKLKAEDYILKPIDILELTNAIKSAVASIEREVEKETERRELLAKIEENMPLLRERFLISLILGDFTNNDNMLDRMKVLGISFLSEGQIVAVNIFISNIKQANQKTDDNYNTTYLNLRILDTVREAISNLGNGIAFNKYDNEIVALICFGDGDPAKVKELLNKACCDLLQKIKYSFNVGLNIGIGDKVEEIIKVSQSYQQAVEALNQRFLLGVDQYIFYSDIFVEKDFVFKIPQGIIKEIQNCIYSNDLKSIEGIIYRLFQPLYKSSGIVSEVAQNIRLELFGWLIEVIKSANITVELQWNEYMNLVTLEDIEHWIYDTVLMISENFNKVTLGKTDNVIHRIKQLIVDKFNEPINVQYMADFLKMSPNYISALFKHDVGMNLIEYLTNYRLEKSIELMGNSSLNIKEICKKCGYDDQNYFTKLFKKRFGINPSEYRESKK